MHNAPPLKELHSSPNKIIIPEDGSKNVHPVDNFVRCECSLYFFWNNFKHIGDSLSPEVLTASKEIVQFHDYGIVVFPFSFSDNEPSIVGASTGLLDKRKA
jgi:hypothetical protein